MELTFLAGPYTGLDPAGPGFSLEDTDNRLDVTDADFLDIVREYGFK